MELETITKLVPKNEDLIHAIAIRICRPFPALNLANALGGMETVEWKIIRKFSIQEMINEARERGIDVANIVATLPDEEGICAKLKDTRYVRFL